MKNEINILPAPRSISEQFEVHGFEYSIGDGLCIGLDHADLDSPVYVDYDEDEPNVYSIEGHDAYSIEEAQAILAEILKQGNNW
jgi:hypothetical protein